MPYFQYSNLVYPLGTYYLYNVIQCLQSSIMLHNDISTTLDQHKIIDIINDQFIYQLITIIIDFNQQS